MKSTNTAGITSNRESVNLSSAVMSSGLFLLFARTQTHAYAHIYTHTHTHTHTLTFAAMIHPASEGAEGNKAGPD